MDSPHIVDRFSTHLKNVLTRALCFVVERGEPNILPEHVLWALGTERGSIAAELLKKAGVSVDALRALSLETNGAGSKAAAKETSGDKNKDASPNLSTETKHALEKAVLTAQAHRHAYVGTEHLLAGLLQIRHAPLEAFFDRTEVDVRAFGEQIAFALRSTGRFGDLAAAVSAAPGKEAAAPAGPVPASEADERAGRTRVLAACGRELTAKDAQESLDPVIGREREIERVMEILCRRTKNNPLLVGEPGVGKTAIVEGLAKRIHAGDVPPALRGKRIVSVDLAAMIAGTMYRGEFEQRIRQVIEEAKAHPDLILFIDELHTVVGAGSATGSLDAANILKPALARGELRCIGATTPAECKKHIEPDAALERRFQRVAVEEPTPEGALHVLRGLAPAYEAHHRVRFEPEALEAAVRLSMRFLQDRRLPDKAVDLMDEAAASIRVRAQDGGPGEERRLLQRRLEELRERKQEAVLREQFKEAVELKEEEETLTKAMERLVEQPAAAGDATPVTTEHIVQVVSRLSGLSPEDIRAEHADAGALETALSTRVFGQPSAVKTAARALARAKAGLGDPRRPLASFLFLGPSGVGKTEMAKAVAETLFKDPKALLRFDMSEYAEAFTASKLVGAPAGYVGYREGGKLTDQVKARPHSVVLFDEIEKAHPDVQNLLLQLLEEGEVADAAGLPVSFRNAVVVLTSNAGADRFRQGGLGFGATAPTSGTDLRKELEERFRPELLNRLEHVLLFEPLAEPALADVARRQLDELAARLQARGRTLETDAGVAALLAKQADTSLGARDIRRLIQTHVEERLADLIGTGTAFRVCADGACVDVRVK